MKELEELPKVEEHLSVLEIDDKILVTHTVVLERER